ncbi:MAG: hypothetical protein JW990_00975 [Thermoleophilia bacterium]|nr:hypothetical protein [Thermoleophilia bacterium]
MKVLVLLEVGADVRLAPPRDPRTGRVRKEWLVREIDPGSARALDLALRLKSARSATQVTVVHLGASDSEPWLRQALAGGADQAIRVWDDELDALGGEAGIHVRAKVVVLAAAARAAGFDLILCGAAGVVDAGSQLGVLLAADLEVPCVTQVVDLAGAGPADGADAPDLGAATQRLRCTRALDRGFSERVEAPFPVVATVSAAQPASEGAPPVVTVSSLLAARSAEIVTWHLADLGVPLDDVRRAERLLRHGRPGPLHPRIRPIAAPDAALPAFDRILKLIEGTVKRRAGRVVRLPADAMVEEIFRSVKEEGWLDHLRPEPRSENADLS